MSVCLVNAKSKPDRTYAESRPPVKIGSELSDGNQGKPIMWIPSKRNQAPSVQASEMLPVTCNLHTCHLTRWSRSHKLCKTICNLYMSSLHTYIHIYIYIIRPLWKFSKPSPFSCHHVFWVRVCQCPTQLPLLLGHLNTTSVCPSR